MKEKQDGDAHRNHIIFCLYQHIETFGYEFVTLMVTKIISSNHDYYYFSNGARKKKMSASYMTQFSRASRSSRLPKEVISRLHSKNAVERRLVLPLDAGHWIRALEVFNAKYAREGRTAYQLERILNVMFPSTETAPPAQSSSSSSHDMVNVLHAMRDGCLEGSIPSSESLWIKLTKCYASMNLCDEAIDTAAQAMQRLGDARVNEWGRKELCLALLPALARQGRYEDAKNAAKRFLPPLLQSDRTVASLLAEAAARQGLWARALAQMDPRDALPAPALAGLASGLASDGFWWQALLQYDKAVAAGASNLLRAQRGVLNAVAAAGHWAIACRFWQQCMVGTQPPARNVDPVMLRLVLHAIPSSEATHSGANQQASMAPQSDSQDSGRRVILRILDWLCYECEAEWSLDNICGSVFVRALLDEGDWVRALHLVGSTPLLKGKGCDVSPRPSANGDDRSVTAAAERRLAAMVYAMHGISPEARRFTVQNYPFAFPRDRFPELVSRVESEKLAHSSQSSAQVEAPPLLPAQDDERFFESMHQRTRAYAPSVRIGHVAYSNKERPTTAMLTERAEEQLREGILRLHRNKHLMKFVGDENADPRPIPKGLHDYAAGWAFNGRNGEMMFSNSKRYSSNLSKHPKHMAMLINGDRGWNPRQSSSLAHQGSGVRKWNGKSAV